MCTEKAVPRAQQALLNPPPGAPTFRGRSTEPTPPSFSTPRRPRRRSVPPAPSPEVLSSHVLPFAARHPVEEVLREQLVTVEEEVEAKPEAAAVTETSVRS